MILFVATLWYSLHLVLISVHIFYNILFMKIDIKIHIHNEPFHLKILISFRLMLDDICLTSSTSLTLFLNWSLESTQWNSYKNPRFMHSLLIYSISKRELSKMNLMKSFSYLFNWIKVLHKKLIKFQYFFRKSCARPQFFSTF